MKPICKPLVDTHLRQMNGLQRSTESFRYVVLNIEWWISPAGQIRNWVNANIRVAVFIAAPTLLVFPVITMTLWELESCLNALTAIASKLIFLPFLALLVFISISIVLKIIGVLKR